MKPEVSIIKELNEENPQEVYLCDDATKVIKGSTTRVGKPIVTSLISKIQNSCMAFISYS
jgi:hypothetical protein